MLTRWDYLMAKENMESSYKQAKNSTGPATKKVNAATEGQSSGGMGGFAKGLSVIEAFSNNHEGMSIADIARITGLDRATARRCIITLVNTGYATANGRLYSLTPRVLRLSSAYLNASLPRLLQPSLESLAEKLHESCSAAILDKTEIMYIARASQHRVMSIGLQIGSRLPAYCTSMGRVLLAALPTEEARERLRSTERKPLTPHTLTKIDDLMEELNSVRGAGYAINDQELELGLRSIAVPVRNIAGKVVAALNVGVPAAHISTTQLRKAFLPQLLDETAKLAEVLP